MAVDTAQSKGLEWKWIVFGVVAGTLLCVSLHQIMGQTFHNSLIPTFISLLGFVIMGIIIGFKSEGYTLKEPAIGGLVTLFLVGYILSVEFGYDFTLLEKILAPVVGLILGLIGGWVGEQIQVTPEEAKREIEEEKSGKKLQWGWIIAGTVLAFTFNAFFVFGGFAMLKFGEEGILMSLGASFLFAGLLIAYFSPGKTIVEPAIAGILSMVLNFLLLYLGFDRAVLPVTYIAGTLVGGFLLSLVGGWIGEKLQSFLKTDREHEKE